MVYDITYVPPFHDADWKCFLQKDLLKFGGFPKIYIVLMAINDSLLQLQPFISFCICCCFLVSIWLLYFWSEAIGFDCKIDVLSNLHFSWAFQRYMTCLGLPLHGLCIASKIIRGQHATKMREMCVKFWRENELREKVHEMETPTCKVLYRYCEQLTPPQGVKCCVLYPRLLL